MTAPTGAPLACADVDARWGNAKDLSTLGNAEADLILTSPPYFPSAVEPDLRAPRRKQTRYDEVERGVLEFAVSLRSAFDEMARVLKPGRALVLQTGDIRYGGFLIPLSDVHRELVSSTGLRLVTRVFWLPAFRFRRLADAFRRSPRVGAFRAEEPETFLVFAHPEGLHSRGPLPVAEADGPDCTVPLWSLPAGYRRKRHPYGSSPIVTRRWLTLLSCPGDLVVDPFMGFGTTLVEARRMGRRAWGCDSDEACLIATTQALGHLR
jgi:DNA modification methylase